MDLFTYSFPCTDISQAGKMLGFEEGSGTRSSLLWECKRIIDGKKPKYLLLENVKNLVGKKFKPNFDLWLEWLSEQGYTNYWKVLNAKDYGIPQNRERVFVISILGEHEPYKFPEKLPLTLRMKDLLEDTVDEKFYLSQEQINKIKFSTFNTNARRIQEKEYCDTLCARDFKDPKCVKINQIGQYDRPNRKNCSIYRVYNDNGLSPSLNTMQGGNLEPHIIDDKPKLIGGIGETNFGKQYRQGNRIYDSNSIAMALLSSPVGNAGGNSYLYRIVCEQRSDEGLRFFKNNICGSLRTNNSCGDKRVIIGASRGDHTDSGKTEQRLKETTHTLTTSCNQDTSETIENGKKDIGTIDGYCVRKLTPKECWRLMGFPDWAFDKAEQVCSNSQLYKQAGNSIVVQVLEGIFKNLFKE